MRFFNVTLSLEQVKKQALALGWDDCGATSPVIPQADITAYLEWLQRGDHANLTYMEKQLRCHPDQLLEGAQTALLFITHYKQPERPLREDAGLIAAYARGRDYHNVHRSRLKKMIRWLQEQEECACKGFSDSTPILEKALAVKAGLGWFGKNTLLIHRRFGTYTLLSGLLTTLKIAGQQEQERLPRCGSCRRCLDACPTEALEAPYRLNAARCLSYHTIENRDSIPLEIQEKNPGYLFGCDLCQVACPHNVRPPLSLAPEFQEEAGFGAYLDSKQIDEIAENPEQLFGTPLKRKGIKGLQQNILTLSTEKK